MKDSYFKEYYHLERRHWWFQVRNKIIEERIEQLLTTKDKLKILNVGVATGATSEMLSRFGEVISVEYDQACYEFTKEYFKMPLLQGSILELPFGNEEFDLVCAFDVIEHVEDDQKAVSEMKRVCKSTGYVCVTVPAYQWMWSHHDVINHHFRRYTMRSLRKVFDLTGQGNLVRNTYFNTFLFPAIAGFRLLSGLIPQRFVRRGAGSDSTIFEEKSFINRFFHWFFSLERPFLRFKMRFPFGVSAFLAWKVQK